jgi:thiol oxidase
MEIYPIALILLAHLHLGFGGVVPNPFAQYVSKKPDESQVGLYNEAPFVTSLTADSIKPKVYRQNYATYLEFYNSYCGFCRRFAPTWISLSQDVSAWKANVMVAALDCSVDTNSDTCREFEVMAYPTIRYFPPKYEEGEKKIGVEINKGSGTVEELRERLVEGLVAEEVDVPNWPNFQRQQQVDKDQLFASQPDTVKYIFFVYEPNATSTLAAEVMLDFTGSRTTISVQRIGDSTDLLDEVELDRQKVGLLAVDRELTVTNVALADGVDRTKIRDTINAYCSSHHVSVSTTSSTAKSGKADSVEVTPIPSIQDLMKQKQDEAIREKVSHLFTCLEQFQAKILCSMIRAIANAYAKVLGFSLSESKF